MKSNRLVTLFASGGAPLLMLASGSLAQESSDAAKHLDASPRHQEWIDITTSQGRTVRAFLVYPEVSKPAPGVLVIHENRGLTDWVRSVADRLAETGYVALAPDLLSQTGPDGGGTDSYPGTDAAREAIYKLPDQQVLDDLDACAQHLRGLDATSDVLFVAGFCWGGGQAFRYAAHNDTITAAFVFYGTAPTEKGVLSRIKAPVYGFYGGDDFRVTGEVPKTEALMKELGKKYSPEVYKDAGHAFMRLGEQTDATPPNREAKQQAWKRWLDTMKALGSSAKPT